MIRADLRAPDTIAENSLSGFPTHQAITAAQRLRAMPLGFEAWNGLTLYRSVNVRVHAANHLDTEGLEASDDAIVLALVRIENRENGEDIWVRARLHCRRMAEFHRSDMAGPFGVR